MDLIMLLVAVLAGVLIGLGLSPFYITHLVKKGVIPKFLRELGLKMTELGKEDIVIKRGGTE